jgi:thiol:disulfide interchange protein DsbD
MTVSSRKFLISVAYSWLLMALWLTTSTKSGWAEVASGKNASISTAHATVSLISDYTAITAGQEFWIGLHFVLKPGWHIYYANPGDSGLPPKLIFPPQQQLTINEIEWPTPERIPFGPLVNYGYQTEVLLPIKAVSNMSTHNGAIELSAQASWLVCEEDCIPEKGSLTLTIQQARESVASDAAKLFSESIAKQPKIPPNNLVFELTERPGELDLSLPPLLDQATNVYFFSALKSIVKASAPQLVSSSTSGQSLLQLKQASSYKGLPETVSGILTYTTQAGEVQALKINAQSNARSQTAEVLPLPKGKDGGSLFVILLSALIGGIILNLMPCVLPVLSLKVLSLVNQAEDSRRQQLLLTLCYTLGIISSLVALGGLLLILREQGAKIGWGFQLQYAPFIGLLTLFFFILGLSFLGFIEFGGRLASKAANLDKKEGVAGAFLSGLLATLVATPCTAPFLGTAVGVALIRPWYQALAIFASMGLGIALPYILLVVTPSARKLLPRPGAWMITFKELLAFPLFATSLWLLWVLSIQRGGHGVLLVLLSALILVFGLWIYKSAGTIRSLQSSIMRSLAICIVVLGSLTVILPDLLTFSRSEKTNLDGSISDVHGLNWIPYSEETLKQFRTQGKTIYLDFTAAWCITCQVNKSVVFSDKRVIDHVLSKGVILMRADWTNQDPLISNLLESYGRASVPFNIIFHGLTTTPIELPTILTPAVVLESFSQTT